MTLRTKKVAHPKKEDGEATPRNSQRVKMPHNSVFVLGSRTNAKWLHGVRADKRPLADKCEEERAYNGQRISLTFRNIGTYTNRTRTKIWGQGAKSKFQATAGDVITINNSEMESMIIAFGKENHQVDFDWDAEYGEGYDVVNLVVSKNPSIATLFLCGDEISNLRVKMAILERAIPCRLTREKPTDTAGRRSPVVRRTIFSLSGDENPLFRDCDANQSESVGDLAILFYISRFYPGEPDPSISAREMHRVASNVFARITQANELLFLWQELRGMPFNASTRATHQVRRIGVDSTPSRGSSLADGSKPAEAFEGEMEVWEEYAEEAGYISGEVFTIVDCCFWPVLTEIVRRWEGWSERRYPNLANYWRKVGAMPTTRQAMIEKGDEGRQTA
jgi:glutathione S-transferase